MHRDATHQGSMDHGALLGLTFSFTSNPHAPAPTPPWSCGGDCEVAFQVLPLGLSTLTQHQGTVVPLALKPIPTGNKYNLAPQYRYHLILYHDFCLI